MICIFEGISYVYAVGMRQNASIRNLVECKTKREISIAILHEKVRHQRADWLHKESRNLIDRYDYIGIEDLDMKGMSQSLHFGKSVSDNGWGLFVYMLSYKVEMAGKHVIKTDKMFPSSQMCHACGCLNPETKSLNIREWDCPVCGAHHDRDHNATLNLKTEALRIALL